MENLLQILSELHPDVDFNKNVRLIDDGILDSFDIVVLVGEISDKFNVDLSVEDILPENFNSPQAIMRLIESSREK